MNFNILKLNVEKKILCKRLIDGRIYGRFKTSMEYLQSNGFIKPLLFQSNSGSGTVSFIIIYKKFIYHFKDIKFIK